MKHAWRLNGYPRSFAIGVAFSVAWSPCVGPILGAILTIAANEGSPARASFLLTFYALGLGIWFLLFGIAFGWLVSWTRYIRPYISVLLVINGFVFIFVGVLMLLGEFGRLNSYFQSLGFLFEQTSTAEKELSTGTGGLFGPVIAFFGGTISFLSPCVLPLVPVYFANLAGEAAQGTNNLKADRIRVFLHAFVFVIGFTLMFALVGAGVGLGAEFLNLGLVTKLGGAVLVIFGLQMSGLVQIPYLDRTYQLR